MKSLEWGWQAFRIVDTSQKGYPIKTVDNWKTFLFHVEGKDCVSITPLQPARQPQYLTLTGPAATEAESKYLRGWWYHVSVLWGVEQND